MRIRSTGAISECIVALPLQFVVQNDAYYARLATSQVPEQMA
jgi:hypothetical protein